MNSISDMAFYCCGIRMQDAAQKNSICGDIYAKLFMDAYGLGIYDKFKGETLSNVSIIVRHRIIDDILRDMLRVNPGLCLVTIGAGFDSRPYRLNGGTWFELDEPQVIAYKNARLPVSACANPLRRIPIDFGVDSIEEKLLQLLPAVDGRLMVLILEGVFIYLSENAIRELLRIFHAVFATHTLICDLVNRQMVESYGKALQAIVEGIGARFMLLDQPELIFLANGYQARQTISVVAASSDLGINKIPKFMLRYFFAGEIKGNSVYVLDKQDMHDDWSI